MELTDTELSLINLNYILQSHLSTETYGHLKLHAVTLFLIPKGGEHSFVYPGESSNNVCHTHLPYDLGEKSMKWKPESSHIWMQPAVLKWACLFC